ncbi:ABC transporter ATP-binding protein [Corynebacterium mendelii]|uniref:ABC transporter ATP-binding protein n=1 Tax=Corynebacterium mendelii TaxID=2765362 RepID=A0A939ITB5_9CORY|nr:ABC transporter ATP-binding protein [Corynebacterium mendelii]MBN9643669.1 ABC transporter ATP-binding protein [Corynebacterium mendelii]
MTAPSALINATGIQIGYGRNVIIDDLSASFPRAAITTIIGPNGCGKSTLLKALAGLLPHTRGTIELEGKNLSGYRRKQLATTIAVLPQSPVAPEGLVVGDLVLRGRHPHQSWINQWSTTDEDIVGQAMTMTGVADLADRTLDSLSGGQRQRVWIAMVLAQETGVLFLDEPTTYLDMAHSIDVLNLVRKLKNTAGKTIIMVLHDLNLAVRYSDHLVVMKDGAVHATGSPETIITPQLLNDVFDMEAVVTDDPVVGGPLIVPAAPAD